MIEEEFKKFYEYTVIQPVFSDDVDSLHTSIKCIMQQLLNDVIALYATNNDT